MRNMTTRGWTCHTRAQPECDIFNQGTSYFHVPRSTVCHMFCLMTNKISYKMVAYLRVLPTRWRLFWEIYPQDGSVGILPTRWRRQTKRKQKQRRIYLSFAFSERRVTSPGLDIIMSTRVTVKRWTLTYDMLNVTWRRFDQSAKQIIVGHATIMYIVDLIVTDWYALNNCTVPAYYALFLQTLFKSFLSFVIFLFVW